MKHARITALGGALLAFCLSGCSTIQDTIISPYGARIVKPRRPSASQADYSLHEKSGFACNEWTDLDRDGIPQVPGEFAGIKKSFQATEHLLLVSQFGGNDLKGREWKIRILTGNNREVYSATATIPSDRIVVTVGGGPGENLAAWLSLNGGSGSYRASWYMDDIFEYTCSFDLTGTLPKNVSSLSHTVRKGDTLSGLAVKFGTTTRAIQKANKLKNDRLTVGRKLNIPAKPTTPTAQRPVPQLMKCR
jgi:hypothetical protein